MIYLTFCLPHENKKMSLSHVDIQFTYSLFLLSVTYVFSSQRWYECSVRESICWSSLPTPDGCGHGHVSLSQLQHASRILSCSCSPSPGSSAAAGRILSAASAVKLQLTADLRWIHTSDISAASCVFIWLTLCKCLCVNEVIALG